MVFQCIVGMWVNIRDPQRVLFWAQRVKIGIPTKLTPKPLKIHPYHGIVGFWGAKGGNPYMEVTPKFPIPLYP